MIKALSVAVAAIDEGAWQTIAYPDEGEAQIAETVYGGRRLVVRRTRLVGPQAEIWPDWRHFAFLTNRKHDLALVEAEHRDHAVVEQVISDLKDQALAHFPSGDFNANGAWTVLAALAHNLLRWTQLIGLPGTTTRAARTLRRRLLQIPGRLTSHARGWTLHLPARWPWHDDYTAGAETHPRAPSPSLTPARHAENQNQTRGTPPVITAAREHPNCHRRGNRRTRRPPQTPQIRPARRHRARRARLSALEPAYRWIRA